jgi:hypothetical protein
MAIGFSTVQGTGWQMSESATATGVHTVGMPTDGDVNGNYVLAALGARATTLLATEALTVEDIVETPIVDVATASRSAGVAGGFQDGTPSDGTISLSYASAGTTNTAKSGLLIAASGVDTSTPIAASASNTGVGTTVTFPDTASVSSGDLILRIVFWEGTAGTDVPAISGFTEQFGSDLPGGDTRLGVAAGSSTSSGGAPGTTTATLSVSTEWLAFTVVLKAAGGGGGDGGPSLYSLRRGGGFIGMSGNMG